MNRNMRVEEVIKGVKEGTIVIERESYGFRKVEEQQQMLEKVDCRRILKPILYLCHYYYSGEFRKRRNGGGENGSEKWGIDDNR